MTYVFDNSPLSTLFRNFYRSRFPSLWGKFDDLVDSGRLSSTREAYREIEDSSLDELRTWAAANQALFTMPTAADGRYVANIFGIPHFQNNIERQKLLRGGKNADPFLVAKAATTGCTLVTMEQLKPNAAKIPNICQHFGVPCMSLEQFMAAEDWTF